MSDFKVWRCNIDGRVHKIVAAKTQKRAAELFGCSVNHLRNYGSVTGNVHDIARAIAEPEVVMDSGVALR